MLDRLNRLGVNRALNSDSNPRPPNVVPDADELADESLVYLDSLFADAASLLASGQPLGEALARLDNLIAESLVAGWIAGSVGVWLGSRQPRVYTLADDPSDGDVFMLDAVGPLQEKRFPWLEEAARWLMDSGVYSADEIRSRWIDPDLIPQWKSIEEFAKVREEIAVSFDTGESFERFFQRVKDTINASKPLLQTAFRTATHQAFIQGTSQTLEKPSVRLQFPFIRYRSAHDTRTRATHRPLDGLLFEIGSPAYAIAQRALRDFNCRCGVIAYDHKDIERKKLKPVQVDELPGEVLEKYGR